MTISTPVRSTSFLQLIASSHLLQNTHINVVFCEQRQQLEAKKHHFSHTSKFEKGGDLNLYDNIFSIEDDNVVFN